MNNKVAYHRFICCCCHIDNKEKSGCDRLIYFSYCGNNKENGNSTHSTLQILKILHADNDYHPNHPQYIITLYISDHLANTNSNS